MKPDTEKKLLKKAQKGDPRSFEKLYDFYLDTVYGFIYNRVNHKEDTEDLTTDVFLKVVRNLEDFRFESSFKTWILRIAYFTVADYWRSVYAKEKCEISFEEEWLSYGENDIDAFLDTFIVENDQEILSDALNEGLSMLSDKYQSVLKCRFIENRSVKDCAKELHITENNLKVLQNRAVKRLKEAFIKKV